MEPTRTHVVNLALSLLLNQREVVGHVIKGLMDGLERDLELLGELLRSTGIGTMNCFVNDCRANSPPLEEQLAIVGVRTGFQVLVQG
jgi:hypothetical protein